MSLRSFAPLVPRGAAGVCCDDGGLTLSGVPLVIACRDGSGYVRYRARSTAELRQLLRALDVGEEALADCVGDIERIAAALDSGNILWARRVATGLGVPAASAAMQAALGKAGFNPAEPRDSNGRWVTFAVPNYRAQVFANRANRNDAWNRFHAAARALPGQSGTQSFAYGETFAGEGGMTPAGARVAGINQADLTAAKAAMPEQLSDATTVANMTVEQAAAVYRYMADQNFDTVGGSTALDQVGDPYAAAALNDTMFWEGPSDGSLTIQQAINQVAGPNTVPEDNAMGPATLNAHVRLAQDPETRAELLDALAQNRTDWATAKGQNDPARIDHFRFAHTQD